MFWERWRRLRQGQPCGFILQRVLVLAITLTASRAKEWELDGPVEDPCDPVLLATLETQGRWETAARPNFNLCLSYCDCLADEETGASALHLVASRAQPGDGRKPVVVAKVIEKLVFAGARLLSRDVQNATALHVAAARGSGSVVAGLCDVASRYGLLENLLSAVETRRQTALNIAEASGHVNVASLLVSWGSRRSGDGDVEISPLTKSGDCEGPLLDAVLRGKADDVRSILGSAGHGGGANCFVPHDKQRRRILHFAASAADFVGPSEGVMVSQVLLDFGANASHRDAIGELPLAAAVRKDQADIAKLLLEEQKATASAEENVVNSVDNENRTVLHVAAANGATISVHLLLENGAKPEAADVFGLTPGDLASRGGHTEVFSIIDTAMSDPLGVYKLLRNDVNKVSSGFYDPFSEATAARVAEEASSNRNMLPWIVAILSALVGLGCIVGICCSIRYLGVLSIFGGKKSMVSALDCAPTDDSNSCDVKIPHKGGLFSGRETGSSKVASARRHRLLGATGWGGGSSESDSDSVSFTSAPTEQATVVAATRRTTPPRDEIPFDNTLRDGGAASAPSARQRGAAASSRSAGPPVDPKRSGRPGSGENSNPEIQDDAASLSTAMMKALHELKKKKEADGVGSHPSGPPATQKAAQNKAAVSSPTKSKATVVNVRSGHSSPRASTPQQGLRQAACADVEPSARNTTFRAPRNEVSSPARSGLTRQSGSSVDKRREKSDSLHAEKHETARGASPATRGGRGGGSSRRDVARRPGA